MKPVGLVISLIFLFASVGFSQKPDFIVSQDGSGNFRTVQEAINAVPDFRKKTTIILVKKGVYKEKLILAGSKKMVKFIGEDVEKTILTYDDFNQKKNVFGEEKGTSGSASFYVYGDEFSAENITFQNSSGPVGQAVALWNNSDKSIFKNCRFLGFQDTLYTFGAGIRQYYFKCYIEGSVDFIFGSATAVFDECRIFSKSPGYITASSAPDTSNYGYVFRNCKIVGNAPEKSVFLGRPWRPFAKAVFIDCELGNHIKPEGWDNWGKESNEKTAYYAEFNNSGPGAHVHGRVKWSRQLTGEQAKNYSFAKIFKGWAPAEAEE